MFSTLLTRGGHTAQVKNAAGQWVAADPIPGTLVCNIGDMLRVWTHGLYKVRGQRPRTSGQSLAKLQPIRCLQVACNLSIHGALLGSTRTTS
jgi:hypothetical protein